MKFSTSSANRPLGLFGVVAAAGLTLLFSALSDDAVGQVTNYSFSQSVGTYTTISGGQVLGSATTDDQRFVDPAVPAGGTTLTGVGLPIGFTFSYNGFTYDRFAINANGWISLGSSSLSPAVNITSSGGTNPNYQGYLSATNTFTPVQLRARLGAFGSDLQGQTGSELRYETLGPVGNRVLVVQWTNYRRFSQAGLNLNFQIRLYESDGAVEFHYGPQTWNATANFAQAGIGGNATSDFLNRTTTTNWNATTAGGVVGATLSFSTAVTAPTGGRIFRYASLACSGTPSPGNTIASNATPCLNETITLSLQNETLGSGVSYQWQTSPDGNDPWSNFGGNSPSQSVTYSSDSYYRCIVTCSGNDGISNPIEITLSTNDPCTCPSAYCTSASTNTIDEHITNVTFAGINQNSGSTTYSDFRCTEGTVLVGDTYTFSASVSNNTASTFTETVKVYIDWNQNNIFDAGESYPIGSISVPANSVVNFTNTITVPMGATLGTTMMRVILRFSSFHPDNGCGSFGFGEVEDYSLNIAALPCQDPPTAGAAQASSTNLCTAQIGSNVTLSLSGASGGLGQTFQWQSSSNGVDFTDISGATSATAVVSVSATTHYRCVVTCGSSTTSAPVTVTVSPTPGLNINNPIVITPGTYSGNNLAPCYVNSVGNAAPDTWYAITTSGCSNALSASVCVSSFDTFLRIFDAGGVQIATDDDGCTSPNGLGSLISNFPVSPNTLYYIVVEGFGSNSGTFELVVSESPAPVFGCTDMLANNYDPAACEDDGSCTYTAPIIIPSTSFPGCNEISGTLASPGATNLPYNGPFVIPGDPSNDVLHSLQLPFEGAIKVKATATDIDLVIELYDSNFNLIGGADSFFGAAVPVTEIAFVNGLAAGTYFVRVYGYTGELGPYTICATTYQSTNADVPFATLTYNACGVYKCGFRPSASGYQWTFEAQNAPATLTFTQNTNNTWLPLSNLSGGVQYGEVYDVTVAPLYNDADLGLIAVNGVTTDLCVMETQPTTAIIPAQQNATIDISGTVKTQISCNASGYVFEFTNTATNAVSTAQLNNSTVLPLCNVPGILPGTVYSVRVAVIYNNITYGFGTAYNITTAPYAPVTLRAQDNCNVAGAVSLNYTIWTNAFRACAKDYTWEFTPTVGLPIYHKKGSGVRSLKLNEVSGLTPGETYTVRVKAEYGNFTGFNLFTGEPQYDFATAYGSAGTVCLIGPANTEFIGEELMETITAEAPGLNLGVYPNPAVSAVNISLDGVDESTDKIAVDVYDVFGKMVFSSQFASQGQRFFATIDLGSELSSGLYLMNIRAGEQTEIVRLVIQR